MENQLKYSFDDEVVEKFCCDVYNKSIHIYFSGYSDLISNTRFLDRPCMLAIENWKSASCLVNEEKRHRTIDSCLGVFNMILYIKKINENVELYVSTLDGRFILINFENVFIELNDE